MVYIVLLFIITNVFLLYVYLDPYIYKDNNTICLFFNFYGSRRYIVLWRK